MKSFPYVDDRGVSEADFSIPEEFRDRLLARSYSWRVTPADTPEVPDGGDRITRRATMPNRRRALAVRSVCGVIRTITHEMVALTSGRACEGRDGRFARSHIQQIAMYVCHIVLQMTMAEIATAFGRDRTTVGHSCARVEDRRDDRAYDMLITSVERVVAGVFAPVRSGH